MRIGLSDKDQTQVKDAFSTLWDVCGNTLNNIFNDKINSPKGMLEMHKESGFTER